MKIMSIGAGFVSDHLPYQKIDERISNSSDIEMFMAKHKPDVLVNCIGFTGRPNIDQCELNREKTAFTNTAIPIMLADYCAKYSIHLIQIGSGCIFFGESPNKFITGTTQYAVELDTGWTEEDFANPKSYYSKSKYACDLMLGQMSNVATLRIRMPISEKNNPRNLINKLRGYNQIIDIPNSMTFMSDLTRCIDWTARNTKTGIFHIVNPEPLTAARIMNEYKRYFTDHQFSIINEDQLDKLTVAKRSNCILDGEKLRKAGFVMTPSEIALKQCMAEYIKNL